MSIKQKTKFAAEGCARARPWPLHSLTNAVVCSRSSACSPKCCEAAIKKEDDIACKAAKTNDTADKVLTKTPSMDSSEDGECSSSVDDANAAACPIRKRRFSNARIQPTRVKKVMQSDEDIGRMVASVPVAIGSAMEHFAEKILEAAAGCVPSSSSRTLSPMHIKLAIMKNPHFAFLESVIKDIKLPKVSEMQSSSSAPSRTDAGSSLPIPPYISQLFSGVAAGSSGAGPSTSASSLCLPQLPLSIGSNPSSSAAVDFAAVFGRLAASGNNGSGVGFGASSIGTTSLTSSPMKMQSPQSGSDLTGFISTSSTNSSTSLFSSSSTSVSAAGGGKPPPEAHSNNHYGDNNNGSSNLVKRKRGRPPRADRITVANGSASLGFESAATDAANLLFAQMHNSSSSKRQLSVGEERDRTLMPPPAKVPPMRAASLNGSVDGLSTIFEDENIIDGAKPLSHDV